MQRVVAVLLLFLPFAAGAVDPADYIRPYAENPRYWQYKGEPVLLLGGSKDDNLFQIPDLEAQLDELKAAGGNVIRNTMSARQDAGFEVYPFERSPDGKYDLDRWNDAYWQRFENCLRLCAERDIVVQIEVWDRFDYSQQHWEASPWRPANNANYSVEQSGLTNQYPQPAWRDKQPFFHTIPGMPLYAKQLDLVRGYQERIVDKMLSYSLQYGNVLYCMDNETSTPPAWGRYWMKRIQDAAAAQGVTAYVTDMFDDGWEPQRSAKIRQAIDDPKAYTFIDISQVNSRSFNEEHWNRTYWVVQQLADSPRPLNNTKIYSDGGIVLGFRHPDGRKGTVLAQSHRGRGVMPVSPSRRGHRTERHCQSLHRVRPQGGERRQILGRGAAHGTPLRPRRGRGLSRRKTRQGLHPLLHRRRQGYAGPQRIRCEFRRPLGEHPNRRLGPACNPPRGSAYSHRSIGLRGLGRGNYCNAVTTATAAPATG